MQKPRSSGEAFPHESKTTHSSNNNKVLPPKVRISGEENQYCTQAGPQNIVSLIVYRF